MSNVFGQVASNLTASQKTASRTNLDLDNVTETRVAEIEARKNLCLDDFAHFQGRKATGVSGGATTVGINTVPITTTIENSITGASLLSDTITLPAGDYYIEGFSTVTVANGCRSTWYNTTDASVTVLGPSLYESAGATYGGSRSDISGSFSIPSSKDFNLRLWVNNPYADGLGLPVSDGNPEIYSDIKIWKL